MTIHADIARELPELRRQAESLMTLTLAAYSPTGNFTTDPDGYEVPEYTPEGSTFGKVQGTSNKDTPTRYVTIGGVERPVIEGGLHIPVSAPVPTAGEQRGLADGPWEYVVTATGDADPALLGRRYMVVGVPAKSYATARRLDVVEVG